jgi:hypothetical protein
MQSVLALSELRRQVDPADRIPNPSRSTETWSDEVGGMAAEEEGLQRLSACRYCDRGCKPAVGAGGWARCRRIDGRPLGASAFDTQAVLALARRRLNVLWAMLRDNAIYQPAPIIAVAA